MRCYDCGLSRDRATRCIECDFPVVVILSHGNEPTIVVDAGGETLIEICLGAAFRRLARRFAQDALYEQRDVDIVMIAIAVDIGAGTVVTRLWLSQPAADKAGDVEAVKHAVAVDVARANALDRQTIAANVIAAVGIGNQVLHAVGSWGAIAIAVWWCARIEDDVTFAIATAVAFQNGHLSLSTYVYATRLAGFRQSVSAGRTMERLASLTIGGRFAEWRIIHTLAAVSGAIRRREDTLCANLALRASTNADGTGGADFRVALIGADAVAGDDMHVAIEIDFDALRQALITRSRAVALCARAAVGCRLAMLDIRLTVAAVSRRAISWVESLGGLTDVAIRTETFAERQCGTKVNVALSLRNTLAIDDGLFSISANFDAPRNANVAGDCACVDAAGTLRIHLARRCRYIGRTSDLNITLHEFINGIGGLIGIDEQTVGIGIGAAEGHATDSIDVRICGWRITELHGVTGCPDVDIDACASVEVVITTTGT